MHIIMDKQGGSHMPLFRHASHSSPRLLVTLSLILQESSKSKSHERQHRRFERTSRIPLECPRHRDEQRAHPLQPPARGVRGPGRREGVLGRPLAGTPPGAPPGDRPRRAAVALARSRRGACAKVERPWLDARLFMAPCAGRPPVVRWNAMDSVCVCSRQLLGLNASAQLMLLFPTHV